MMSTYSTWIYQFMNLISNNIVSLILVFLLYFFIEINAGLADLNPKKFIYIPSKLNIKIKLFLIELNIII